MTEDPTYESLDGPTQAAPAGALSKATGRVDWIVGAVFALLILLVAYLLFFVTADTPLFGNVQEVEKTVREYGALTVAYDQPLLTYEPTVSDLTTRGYLTNIYEGLVRFDSTLSIEPALALSWGMLDDLTWQFKLRPDVLFHDGSTFEARDVVSSIDRARSHPDSEVQNLVSSIRDVVVVDDLTIHLKTSYPDPTLLNKLTSLFVVSSTAPSRMVTPSGTGPYVFSNVEGEAVWKFVRNSNYWGKMPAYLTLVLMSVPDKFQRYEGFLAGKIDVMAQVPPVFVDPLLAQDYKIASQPSLEVNFLLYGWVRADSPFRRRELRDALRYIFDPAQMSKLTGGYARPIGQFVSRGVFGYHPDLDPFPYDLERARALVASVGKNIPVRLDLPRGLESLGDYAEQQLSAVGLSPIVTYWDPAIYSERVVSGESDFYFFGWRSDLGDAGDFFDKMVHSATLDGRYGVLNNGRYSDLALDRRIESMDRNLLEAPRLEAMQDLMDFVVNDAIIGVPLFETDTLIAIQPDLNWDPRVDNLILAADFN